MGVFAILKAITKPVGFVILILLLLTLLIAGYSLTPKTYIADTSQWHIKITTTNITGKAQVTYEYKGSLSQLNKYKHIELTFNTPTRTGQQKIDIYSENGMTEKRFNISSTTSRSDSIKSSVPTASITFGDNGIKETTKLIKE